MHGALCSLACVLLVLCISACVCVLLCSCACVYYCAYVCAIVHMCTNTLCSPMCCRFVQGVQDSGHEVVCCDVNPVNTVWGKDRPALECQPIVPLEVCYTGNAVLVIYNVLVTQDRLEAVSQL